MAINSKVKEFLWGFIGLVLVGVFTFLVVRQQTDKASERYAAKLEVVRQEANIAREQAAKKRDSAYSVNVQNNQELRVINDRIIVLQSSLTKLQSTYDKTLNQLNTLKNEKDYIPNNVSAIQQSAYITGFEYQPYGSPVTQPNR